MYLDKKKCCFLGWSWSTGWNSKFLILQNIEGIRISTDGESFCSFICEFQWNSTPRPNLLGTIIKICTFLLMASLTKLNNSSAHNLPQWRMHSVGILQWQDGGNDLTTWEVNSSKSPYFWVRKESLEEQALLLSAPRKEVISYAWRL